MSVFGDDIGGTLVYLSSRHRADNGTNNADFQVKWPHKDGLNSGVTTVGCVFQSVPWVWPNYSGSTVKLEYRNKAGQLYESTINLPSQQIDIGNAADYFKQHFDQAIYQLVPPTDDSNGQGAQQLNNALSQLDLPFQLPEQIHLTPSVGPMYQWGTTELDLSIYSPSSPTITPTQTALDNATAQSVFGDWADNIYRHPDSLDQTFKQVGELVPYYYDEEFKGFRSFRGQNRYEGKLEPSNVEVEVSALPYSIPMSLKEDQYTDLQSILENLIPTNPILHKEWIDNFIVEGFALDGRALSTSFGTYLDSFGPATINGVTSLPPEIVSSNSPAVVTTMRMKGSVPDEAVIHHWRFHPSRDFQTFQLQSGDKFNFRNLEFTQDLPTTGHNENEFLNATKQDVYARGGYVVVRQALNSADLIFQGVEAIPKPISNNPLTEGIIGTNPSGAKNSIQQYHAIWHPLQYLEFANYINMHNFQTGFSESFSSTSYSSQFPFSSALETLTLDYYNQVTQTSDPEIDNDPNFGVDPTNPTFDNSLPTGNILQGQFTWNFSVGVGNDRDNNFGAVLTASFDTVDSDFESFPDIIKIYTDTETNSLNRVISLPAYILKPVLMTPNTIFNLGLINLRPSTLCYVALQGLHKTHTALIPMSDGIAHGYELLPPLRISGSHTGLLTREFENPGEYRMKCNNSISQIRVKILDEYLQPVEIAPKYHVDIVLKLYHGPGGK